MIEIALTDPFVRNPLFSRTAPRTLSIWHPRNPIPATIAAFITVSETEFWNMIMPAKREHNPMSKPPEAAAS